MTEQGGVIETWDELLIVKFPAGLILSTRPLCTGEPERLPGMGVNNSIPLAFSSPLQKGISGQHSSMGMLHPVSKTFFLWLD
jgi:hypothetical protein